jgi:hypothetical protein
MLPAMRSRKVLTDQHIVVEVRNGISPVLEVKGVFSSKIFRKQ